MRMKSTFFGKQTKFEETNSITASLSARKSDFQANQVAE